MPPKVAPVAVPAAVAAGPVHPNNPPMNTGRTWFQSPLPHPPQINIVQGNIFADPADVLVVVADAQMLVDRQAAPGRGAPRRWHTYAGPALTAYNNNNLHHNAAMQVVPMPLDPEDAIRIPSFNLVNCNWVIMANPPQYDPVVPVGNRGRLPGNTHKLYKTYREIFKQAFRVPLAVHVGYRRPTSIVMPLMGSGAVGYDYDDAAGAAIDALFKFWYNSNAATALDHRTNIQCVTFMVPTTARLYPGRIKKALLKAVRARLAAPGVALGIPVVPALPAAPEHALRSGGTY